MFYLSQLFCLLEIFKKNTGDVAASAAYDGGGDDDDRDDDGGGQNDG